MRCGITSSHYQHPFVVFLAFRTFQDTKLSASITLFSYAFKQIPNNFIAILKFTNLQMVVYGKVYCKLWTFTKTKDVFGFCRIFVIELVEHKWIFWVFPICLALKQISFSIEEIYRLSVHQYRTFRKNISNQFLINVKAIFISSLPFRCIFSVIAYITRYLYFTAQQSWLVCLQVLWFSEYLLLTFWLERGHDHYQFRIATFSFFTRFVLLLIFIVFTGFFSSSSK